MIIRKDFTSNIEVRDNKLVAVITTGDRDRDGDIIDPTGAVIDNYLKNPVIMFAHDYWSLPIGKASSVKIMEDRIEVEPVFAPASVNPVAPLVENAYKEGFMTTWSIGFIPLVFEPLPDGKGSKYTKWELLEFSAVPIPSNPNAITEIKGIVNTFEKNITWKKDKKIKHVCGDTNLPLWDDPDWNAELAEARMRKRAGGPNKEDIDWDKYAEGFVYVIKGEEENFTGYKLPFADIQDDILKAKWGGVRASMAAVLGARGGVDIPETDRRQCYNFLARYYERFDREAPEYRDYTPEEIKEIFGEDIFKESESILDRLKALQQENAELNETIKLMDVEITELKAGRVLSEKNRQLIKNCIDVLNEAISKLEELYEATDIHEESDGENTKQSITDDELIEMMKQILQDEVAKYIKTSLGKI